MANYLKNENQLILWPVIQKAMESDLFQGHIGIRARYDMTNQELLDACVETFQMAKDKSYRLLLTRPNESEMELLPDLTVAEVGLRNGDPLKIVEA